MKKFALNRRAVLRGMIGGSAVMLGLPLLEAMLDNNGEALADGGALPTRFMTWFWGNGAYLPAFEPSEVGATWNLSQCLAPLAPVKAYVNVCTGLQNRCRKIITHHEGMCGFSGWDIIPFTPPPPAQTQFNSHMGGPTIDQLVANKIATSTPVRAIHVGIDRKISPADGGETLAALSHAGTLMPEYPEQNPQKIWSLLFGNYSVIDDKDVRLGIVGAVKDDLARLQKRLGKIDKDILDRHLDGVNALEKKIQTIPPVCQVPMQPTETNPDIPNQDFAAVNDVMSDLITMAFKCDVTRVATNLFHYGAGTFHYWMISQGAYEHHFDNTHQGASGWQQRYVDVVTYCMDRLSSLAQKLMAATDPTGGNLLDSTILYASSDCGVGWTHDIARQPIVLVGHGRNKLKYPGIHYQATPDTSPGGDHPPAAGNMSDVLLTVLQAYDPTATQIGDLGGEGIPPGSKTPLEDIRGSG